MSKRFLAASAAVASLLGLSHTFAFDVCPIAGDVNADNAVDLVDLTILLSNFGKTNDVNAGLRAHLTFDGSFSDAAQNHAITPHGDTTFVAGRVGQAASFSGDDWLEVVHGGDLTFDLDQQSYSIAFWIRISPSQTGEFCVAQDRAPGNNNSTSYLIGDRADSQSLVANVWYGSGNPFNLSAETPRNPLVGDWHHIAALYGPSGVRLYVDGELAGSVARPNFDFPPNGETITTIGAGDFGFGVTNYFQGELDDLRIYNRALNDEEICTLSGM